MLSAPVTRETNSPVDPRGALRSPPHSKPWRAVGQVKAPLWQHPGEKRPLWGGRAGRGGVAGAHLRGWGAEVGQAGPLGGKEGGRGGVAAREALGGLGPAPPRPAAEPWLCPGTLPRGGEGATGRPGRSRPRALASAVSVPLQGRAVPAGRRDDAAGPGARAPVTPAPPPSTRSAAARAPGSRLRLCLRARPAPPGGGARRAEDPAWRPELQLPEDARRGPWKGRSPQGVAPAGLRGGSEGGTATCWVGVAVLGGGSSRGLCRGAAWRARRPWVPRQGRGGALGDSGRSKGPGAGALAGLGCLCRSAWSLARAGGGAEFRL